MRLQHNLHLAYCTNIHRGETWEETFAALKTYTLPVRDRVSPGRPFAMGLRLSDRASRELYQSDEITQFRHWLTDNECYVFTINGFPFGQFHGTRIKEQVYLPDWQTAARLEYTERLFRILTEILPPNVAGSVSTLPGSYKPFIKGPSEVRSIQENLWRCVETISDLSIRSGKDLHLGLEPEPFGLWENTEEVLACFRTMAALRPHDTRLFSVLGVNYDTCHFALQFEDAGKALATLSSNGIRISKMHLSSALRVAPNEATRAKLNDFADDIYLHQVIGRNDDGSVVQYQDLPQALTNGDSCKEWRIHFHVPLYHRFEGDFGDTTCELQSALDWLARNPKLCSHLELETYTWEVLPEALRASSVVEQLSREYGWMLTELRGRMLA